MPSGSTHLRQVENARIGTQGVSKHYGHVQANKDVTFSALPAQVHAVVGENGAGKSTLMRILQGLEKPNAGHVVLNGEKTSFKNPKQAIAAGIGMVHQEFMLAPELTLLENLVLGEEPRNKTLGIFPTIDWPLALSEARAIQERAGVEIDWHRTTANAPIHIQQYVEIFRLLRRGSDVLILDEPTAVLAPQQVKQLFALLRTLRDQGASIIFISHKLPEVEVLADYVTVMRKGQTIASAPIDELDVSTMTQYIMGDAQSTNTRQNDQQKTTSQTRAGMLKVTGLNVASANRSQPLHDVSFEVYAEEIVGIAGVAGNGQEELMECLAGLREATSGSIQMMDAELLNESNRVFRANGISYVSPDRAQEGLAQQASIKANVIAGSQWNEALVTGPFQRISAVRNEAKKRLKKLSVVYGSENDLVSSLSGGNQQKLVFARETASDPKLMVVSQPTRGVDLNGIAAIHAFIRQHKQAGGAVLLASEEIEELMELSDRILVMSGGQLVGEVKREDFSPETIGELMLSTQEARRVAHG